MNTRMKLAIGVLFASAVSFASAETTYRLIERADGSYVFTPVVPVDVPAEPPVGPVKPLTFETSSACANYTPYADGYTFNDQAWERSCDTNGDGVYDFCSDHIDDGKATFDNIYFRRGC